MASQLFLTRRALRIEQTSKVTIYQFALTASEILDVADISRVSRDEAGKLIGYQRPEVRGHVKEIVDYLNGPDVIFPNPIILALSSVVRFVPSRGSKTSDGLARGGEIVIPLSAEGRPKPGWIVDGQQRALALAQAVNKDFPVPVTAFVADSVKIQRDQFFRINNTKPLPRGLVTELLPEVDTPLPPRLSIKRLPSQLCDALNADESSPFHGLIKRASSEAKASRDLVVTDTVLVKMLEESLSPTGSLFVYRNMSSGDIDSEGLWTALVNYWTAVKETFPDAWGKPAAKSRLMHGAGIKAMGRLMDRILNTVDAAAPDSVEAIKAELARVAPHCRWTSGTWDELGLEWDGVQNVSRHIQQLSNFLIRIYMQSRMSRT
ncbi:DGQHR domain-containing protein DpdB [Saccharothrix obliqua]|uniref:DGQHR domain-containing protein DpdB n=1 Tax=Saccharothrix obliqua TaxID=2861747 RepID=UPI001C5E318F|nr:DGQHR domain-containing protein DpdB [Saccharothrix obliqua]MBW4719406.1 DGQHR domain-containing protein [Saccharothrix obliqua]